MREVNIPEQLSHIEWGIFYACVHLKRIHIPANVSYISDDAFSSCPRLTELTVAIDNPHYCSLGNILYSKDMTELCCAASGITAAKIPESTTTIHCKVFFMCTRLQYIRIPDAVYEIPPYTFAWCKNLHSITIPAGITEILYGAFLGCTSLASLFIPAHVQELGEHLTAGAPNIHLEIDPANPCYCLKSGILYTKDKTEVLAVSPSVTVVRLPNTVRAIKKAAFFGCTKLTTLILSKQLTSIEHSAFKGCSSLTDITIPPGIRHVEPYTFDGCTALTNIILPPELNRIGNKAFRNCTSLTAITIPQSVYHIAPYAFEGCSQLQQVIFTSVNLFYYSRGNTIYKKKEYPEPPSHGSVQYKYDGLES